MDIAKKNLVRVEIEISKNNNLNSSVEDAKGIVQNKNNNIDDDNTSLNMSENASPERKAAVVTIEKFWKGQLVRKIWKVIKKAQEKGTPINNKISILLSITKQIVY